MAKQDHPLLRVFGRHDEIVGAHRPPHIEREARYHDEARVYREYQYDDGAQRKQQQQIHRDKGWELGAESRDCGDAIGSAATHPSLRGALATKQSRGHNIRGASNPDGRTAAPGLLRFARNDGQGIGSLVSACRLGARFRAGIRTGRHSRGILRLRARARASSDAGRVDGGTRRFPAGRPHAPSAPSDVEP